MNMTIAEARAHFGFRADVSDAVVRAAAEAAEITIREAVPAGAGAGSGSTGTATATRGEGEGGDAGEGDDLASLVRSLTTTANGLQQALNTATADNRTETQRQVDALNAQINSALDALRNRGIATPSMRPGGGAPEGGRTLDVTIRDRFDQMGYDGSGSDPGLSRDQRERNMRSNLELAMMIFGGTQDARTQTQPIEVPRDLRAAWEHYVFESGSAPRLSDGEGNPARAMDSAETGYGLELIGAQYASEMWQAARNADGLVGRVREIPMTAPTTYVPIDGDLPEMLFVGESTANNASAYSTSKTGSNRVTLTAKKFTIQQIWSGELNEDSIVAFTPFLRESMNESAALYLGSAYFNGDTTNAGTGNINSDDADPADTKHYLAFDGIRHYWLVDATGQGKNMAAALDPVEITRARGKLNGGDDDVDNLIKNINWGTRAQDLLAIMDWDTYMAMLELDVVKTIDQYGAQATLVTGELGRYMAIPIVAPSYASKTEADGKASGTEASNTKGALTVTNPRGWLAGRRRDVQLFFDRIQRTDQFLFELYTRRAFTRFGGNVAAGVYNITV